MKQLLALLLVLVMLFSVATLFAGCEDGGKKKSSSSKNDDDDEDEDDEDDEDEDEDDKNDDEDKDDENKDDEHEGEIDVDDPSNGKVTEPAGNKATEPTNDKDTQPVETEPVLTPGYELSATLGIELADMDLCMINGCVSQNGTVQSFTVAKEKTGSGEGILYYSDNSGDFFVKVTDDYGYLYTFDGNSYVQDTSASQESILEMAEICLEAFSFFIDIESMLGDSVGYRQINDYQGYACFEAYANGTLVRYIYVDYDTGMVVCIQDAEGNDLVWMEDYATDVVLSDYID